MRTIKLGLAGIVMLALVWLIPMAAAAASDTQTGVSFTPSTTVVDPLAIQSNKQIPSGQATRQIAQQPSADQIAGALQKTMQTGRLPQTAEAYAWYLRIFGGLLLAIALLSYLIWRDARTTERGKLQ